MERDGRIEIVGGKIRVIGPSSGLRRDARRFLNWLTHAGTRSLARFLDGGPFRLSLAILHILQFDDHGKQISCSPSRASAPSTHGRKPGEQMPQARGHSDTPILFRCAPRHTNLLVGPETSTDSHTVRAASGAAGAGRDAHHLHPDGQHTERRRAEVHPEPRRPP